MTSSQFHQNFMSSFCTDILLPKKLQSQTETREKFEKDFHTKKGESKMMKLTPLCKFQVPNLQRTFNKYINQFI
jgi:hypothetical protein